MASASTSLVVPLARLKFDDKSIAERVTDCFAERSGAVARYLYPGDNQELHSPLEVMGETRVILPGLGGSAYPAKVEELDNAADQSICEKDLLLQIWPSNELDNPGAATRSLYVKSLVGSGWSVPSFSPFLLETRGVKKNVQVFWVGKKKWEIFYVAARISGFWCSARGQPAFEVARDWSRSVGVGAIVHISALWFLGAETWTSQFARAKDQMQTKVAAAAKSESVALNFTGICVGFKAVVALELKVRGKTHDLTQRILEGVDPAEVRVQFARRAAEAAVSDETQAPSADAPPSGGASAARPARVRRASASIRAASAGGGGISAGAASGGDSSNSAARDEEDRDGGISPARQHRAKRPDSKPSPDKTVAWSLHAAARLGAAPHRAAANLTEVLELSKAIALSLETEKESRAP